MVLLVKPWVRDVFLDADFIDDMLVHKNGFSGTLSTIQAIRKAHFDAAILFQNAFIAAALVYCARIPVRIGFPTDHRRLLLTHPLDLAEPVRQSHQIFYYLDIASKVEELVFREAAWIFRRRISNACKRSPKGQGKNLSSGLGLDVSRKLIAVNPGATNSRAKQWPADRFAQIGNRWRRAANVHVLLMGAPSEKELSESIARRMQHPPVLLTGQTSLAESIAILSICDLVISNDTGPAYLSAALGRPTLTIFGPTNSI